MTSSLPPIPMSAPDLTEAEREAVQAVLNTPNLSMGQEILAFEKAICDYTGAKHALGVNSGTAGLHLCIRAAGVQDGDWVLTTPFSFVASTNVILFERATPIFVDVDPLTGNINTKVLQEAVRDLCEGGRRAQRWLPRQGVQGDAPRLKALLPVDVFGQPAAMDPIRAVAQEYGLKIIEDSCEAIGATYKGQSAGRLGDYGVFAFYPNKQMTVGEGGVIVTDDDDAAATMRALRNQGRAPGDTWLQHTHLGYNYRLDEMSAALGKVQVSRLDEMLDKRLQVARWYEERFSEIPGVEIPVVVPETTRMSWFVYVIRFAEGIDREAVSRELKARGMPNRPYFIPIHLQPYVANQFGYREGDFPVTEDLGRRGLALPFSGVMPEADVERVCSAIREILHG